MTKSNTLGEKITVACKKGCVFLKDLGSAPFSIVETKRGMAIVPHGFKVATFSDREWWTAETQVTEVEGINTVFYKFTSNRDCNISSDWKETPTEAYKEVNERLESGFKGGGNGQLILGVTYPSLQERILAKFPDAQALLNKSNSVVNHHRSETRKRKKNTMIVKEEDHVDDEVATTPTPKTSLKRVLKIDTQDNIKKQLCYTEMDEQIADNKVLLDLLTIQEFKTYNPTSSHPTFILSPTHSETAFDNHDFDQDMCDFLQDYFEE